MQPEILATDRPLIYNPTVNFAPTTKKIDFAKFSFATVVNLPEKYDVYDFTEGYDPNRTGQSIYGVGRYNEKRRGMYISELFKGERNIHIGIDIASPVGTDVHAFYDGWIFLQGFNPAAGDYGHTIITRHVMGEVELFALHGHLSKSSLQLHQEGDAIHAGEVIAHLGDKHENGGWNPHLHFQLSYLRPEKPDMPGVVSEEDRAQALEIYPDPRCVLGPLY